MVLWDNLYNGKVDAAFMKKIAIITMFIDHATLCFLEIPRNADGKLLMYSIPGGETLDQIGRGIGRLAFPVFCFLLVEGFIYTRSRWKYLLRLLVFALISAVPFYLLVFPESTKRHGDTLFTLATGFVLIWCIDALSKFLPLQYRPVIYGREDRDRMIGLPSWADHIAVRAGIFLAGSAAAAYLACRLAKWGGFDYSYGGVLCIMILYLLYRVRTVSILSAWLWMTYYNQNELLAITGFGLIRCYNGKRGRQNKYFFYLFYPGHLLILYLIRKAIWGI